MIITGPQCRAARALVQLSAEKIAARADLDVQMLRDFENGLLDPGAEFKRVLRETLELGGAVFIPENGGGRGVRLKYSSCDVVGVNKWEAEGGPAGEDDV